MFCVQSVYPTNNLSFLTANFIFDHVFRCQWNFIFQQFWSYLFTWKKITNVKKWATSEWTFRTILLLSFPCTNFASIFSNASPSTGYPVNFSPNFSYFIDQIASDGRLSSLYHTLSRWSWSTKSHRLDPGGLGEFVTNFLLILWIQWIDILSDDRIHRRWMMRCFTDIV